MINVRKLSSGLLALLVMLVVLVGCKNSSEIYKYDASQVDSITLRELKDSGWIDLGTIEESQKETFLKDLNALNFKEAKEVRDTPLLIVEIKFKDGSFHRIGHFCVDEFTKDGKFSARKFNACKKDAFEKLIAQYKKAE